MRYKASVLMGIMGFFGLFSAKAQSVDSLLQRFNSRSIPYITVQTLQMKYEKYLLLDTRELKEYEVSHLPGAIWVGEKANKEQLQEAIGESQKPIVVYCSVGIRSEKYGEQLIQLGYPNVYNLYGSIFYWKDANYELVDKDNQPTNQVHVYSKMWAKYLKTGEKVY